MDLSSNLQTIRKLKPFLEAAEALVDLAKTLDGAQNEEAAIRGRIVKLTAEEAEARSRLESIAADMRDKSAAAAGLIESAEKAAARLTDKARDDARQIADAGKRDGAAIRQRNAEENESMLAKLAAVDAEYNARSAELATLNEHIAKARATIAGFAKV